MDVKLIGITGGSGSGKSTVVRRIKEAQPASVLISQDSYYKSAPFISNENITDYNFDHPDAFDMDLMLSNLQDLKDGKPCMMPQYDFVHHRRLDEFVEVQPEKLITHRYHGMDKIPEAMDLFLHHDRSLIKPVIYND